MPPSFNNNFVRLEYVDRDRFNLAYMRHTGQWFEIDFDLSLEECLDEIEKMAWNNFTINVRSHLRGLADGPDAPLKLVIASRSPLSRLFPDSPELDSPLAGICRQLDVKPFSPGVAREFLLQRLHGTGIMFSEAQIKELIHDTGGHPAKLQEAAAKLYRESSEIRM